MKGPLVSVIIPFYNRVSLCVESVNSVLAQTCQNFEILLVDDGSTEDITVLKEIAAKDNRIYLLSQEHSGAAAARNFAIDQVKGEYVAFLDSDDLWKPEKLAVQLKFMMKHGYSFSHTSYERISVEGLLSGKMNSGRFSGETLLEMIRSCPIAMPTVMVKTEVFADGKYRFQTDYHIGEDICLWIDLARSYTLKGMDAFLTRVRVSSNSAIQNSAKSIEGLQNILEHCRDLPEAESIKKELMDLEIAIQRFVQLSFSTSWRITKPLRAAKAAFRALKNGLPSAVRAFQNSMHTSDRVQNRDILNSVSWRLMRPLRAINGIKKTDRKQYQ